MFVSVSLLVFSWFVFFLVGMLFGAWLIMHPDGARK